MAVEQRIKDGRILLTSSSLYEGKPAITDSLVAHYLFDGTLNKSDVELTGSRVLYIQRDATDSYDFFEDTYETDPYNFIITRIANTDFTASNGEITSSYDLVVHDQYVWAVTSTDMTKAKDLADLGMPVITCGNDTGTNVFVAQRDNDLVGESTNVCYPLKDTHHILGLYEGTELESGSIYCSGSADSNYTIRRLNHGCKPVVYHDFTGRKGIQAYIYESDTGGSVYHDQYGYLFSSPQCSEDTVNNIMKYLLKRSTNRVTNENNTFHHYDKGVAVDSSTTNKVNNPRGTEGVVAYDTAWDSALHPRAIDNDNWSPGYNSGVGSPGTGYHAYWTPDEGIDRTPCMKMIDMNYLYGLGHRWLGISQQLTSDRTSYGWTNGTQITISWYQKVDDLGKQGGVGVYHTEGTNGFYDTITYPYNTEINVWQRHTHTFTVTSDWDSDSFATVYCYGQYGGYGTIWYDNVQVEEKNYATAFVDGSRSSNGNLIIPINSTSKNWSMFVRWQPDYNRCEQLISTPTLFYMNSGSNYLWWADWDSDYTSSESNPYIGIDNIISPDPIQHWHIGNVFTLVPGDEYYMCITKDSDGNIKQWINYDGGSYESSGWSNSNQNWKDFVVENIEFGPTANSFWSKITELAFYNKELSDSEVDSLLQRKSGVSSLESEEIIESEGWTHIYGGPHICLSDENYYREIDYERPGDRSLFFNMMMIRPRHVTSSEALPFKIASLPELCVMSESYRYYTNYLDGLPDVANTRLTLHSAGDGNLDVTASTNDLGYCYGNSWRLYAGTYYVNAGSSRAYLGQYENRFNLELDHWGASYADNYITEAENFNDDLIESQSGYELTPLKASTIDVYVKSGSDVEYETRLLENSLKVKREVLEGVI